MTEGVNDKRKVEFGTEPTSQAAALLESAHSFSR